MQYRLLSFALLGVSVPVWADDEAHYSDEDTSQDTASVMVDHRGVQVRIGSPPPRPVRLNRGGPRAYRPSHRRAGHKPGHRNQVWIDGHWQGSMWIEGHWQLEREGKSESAVGPEPDVWTQERPEGPEEGPEGDLWMPGENEDIPVMMIGAVNGDVPDQGNEKTGDQWDPMDASTQGVELDQDEILKVETDEYQRQDQEDPSDIHAPPPW